MSLQVNSVYVTVSCCLQRLPYHTHLGAKKREKWTTRLFHHTSTHTTAAAAHGAFFTSLSPQHDNSIHSQLPILEQCITQPTYQGSCFIFDSPLFCWYHTLSLCDTQFDGNLIGLSTLLRKRTLTLNGELSTGVIGDIEVTWTTSTVPYPLVQLTPRVCIVPKSFLLNLLANWWYHIESHGRYFQ
jgi:hypothetical protein